MIQQRPNQPAAAATTAESLAPPRPNLGPEPMGSSDPFALVATVVTGGILVIAALAILRRRKRSTSGRVERQSPRDDSPEARLLALRDRARAILAERFGPALRARTTEEVAADAQLAETLGGDNLAQLADLLRAGDRLLFNHQPAAAAAVDWSADLAAWSALIDAIARSRRAARGERPKGSRPQPGTPIS